MKFVGREEEIGELRRIRSLSRTNARFTVITGRRRVGKTELVKNAMGDEPYLYFYVTKKNARAHTGKMELKKYDPVVRKHVVFREAKIK